MMVTAILTRAWIMQMKSYAVYPRVLADDLQVISVGERHLEHFEYAFTKTHKHLADMGAKMAPQKSMTFSSDAASRNWLRTHRWRRSQQTIPVKTDCRDLGTHLNTTAERRVGTTLTERMQKTTRAAERLDRWKAPYDKKAAVIRTKLLPKAIYGCECAPVNETGLRTLRTAFAKALTFVTSRRSSDLTFAVASKGTDVDPEAAILTKRVASIRRATAISPSQKDLALEIYEEYASIREPGVYTGHEDLRHKEVAAEPATTERSRIRRQCKPMGPVGLLMESLRLNAAALDKEFNIWQRNQIPIGITTVAYQHLQPLVRQMAARNRTARAYGTRRECEFLDEIDEYATQGATKTMEPEDRIVLDVVRTGSAWTRATAFWAGQCDDQLCQICGDTKEESDHFWFCKGLEVKRKDADDGLAKLDPRFLPIAIRHGIAPAMKADPRKPFWGMADGGEDHFDKMTDKQKQLIGYESLAQQNGDMQRMITSLD